MLCSLTAVFLMGKNDQTNHKFVGKCRDISFLCQNQKNGQNNRPKNDDEQGCDRCSCRKPGSD